MSTPTQIVRVVYTPDPLGDDRMTIAVIAFSSEGTNWKFLQDWNRASRFGREPVKYVRDWIADFERRLKGKSVMVAASEADFVWLKRLARDSALGSIQVTTPQPVFLDLQTSLDLYADRYLHLDIEASSERRADRKQQLVRDAHNVLDNALLRKFNRPDTNRLVHEDYRIQGRIGGHDLPLALANGRLYLGAFAMSFDRAAPSNLRMEAESLFWTISDVRYLFPNLPLSLLVYPPNYSGGTRSIGVSRFFDEVQSTCEKLDATIVRSEMLQAWADDAVDSLDRHSILESLPGSSSSQSRPI